MPMISLSTARQANPPAMPPYEGRKQSADIAEGSASQVGGAEVGVLTKI
jgi:hypothetical protein